MQSRQIEEEINRVKMIRHGRRAKIFKMKEIVSGPKKGKQDAHPVTHIKGELLFSNEEIKKGEFRTLSGNIQGQKNSQKGRTHSETQ